MSTTKDLSLRYTALIGDCVAEIRQLTKGEKIDLEDDGFEDECGNDIHSVSGDSVFFEDNESYPVSALGFYDALKIIETLQELSKAEGTKG